MTRRRGPAVPGQAWKADPDETCATCGSDRILSGPVGRRRERVCMACGERWTAEP
jgi:hypothetical protein